MFYNSDKLFYNDSHKSGMDASPIHTGFFYLENKQITWISPRTEDGLTARAGEEHMFMRGIFHGNYLHNRFVAAEVG